MIKKNELRVGNCLIYFGRLCQVKGFNIENSQYYVHAFGWPNTEIFNTVDAFEPVPLTEEILKYLGFKVSRRLANELVLSHGSFGDLDWTLRWNVGEQELQLAYCEYYYSLLEGRGYKYVHQLQNVYFILTGEELEITNFIKANS